VCTMKPDAVVGDTPSNQPIVAEMFPQRNVGTIVQHMTTIPLDMGGWKVGGGRGGG